MPTPLVSYLSLIELILMEKQDTPLFIYNTSTHCVRLISNS